MRNRSGIHAYVPDPLQGAPVLEAPPPAAIIGIATTLIPADTFSVAASSTGRSDTPASLSRGVVRPQAQGDRSTYASGPIGPALIWSANMCRPS